MTPTDQFLRAATDWARAELAIRAGKNLPRCTEAVAYNVRDDEEGVAPCYMRAGVPIDQQCAACQARGRAIQAPRALKRNARRRMLRWVERLPEVKSCLR